MPKRVSLKFPTDNPEDAERFIKGYALDRAKGMDVCDSFTFVPSQPDIELEEELGAYLYGVEHVSRNFSEFEGEAEQHLEFVRSARRDEGKEGKIDS